MEQIVINLAYAEIEKRKERWEKAVNFEQPDRIPVLQYLGSRYWLGEIGYGDRFTEYFEDAGTMLKCQLLGQKWILENVKSDFHKIVVYPDFMWVEDVSGFGAETAFSADDSPWVKRPHLLEQDDDLEKLKGVDYVHTGLHGKMIEFYHEMKKVAGDYEIIFKDGKKISAVDCVYPGGGGIIGLACLAGDLCGVENFSIGLYEKPDWTKELLEIITDKTIDWINAVTKLQGGEAAFCADFSPSLINVGDDGTAQMSPPLIEEFMLTPHRRLADHVRSLGCLVQAHNCGKSDHLLDFWTNQIKIDRYIGFSYVTDKQAIKDCMGGKVVLMGGIDTVKLHDGTPDDVIEDCRKNMEIFKDCPGYIMMDGHNVAPGSPVENLNAMTDAAERYM